MTSKGSPVKHTNPSHPPGLVVMSGTPRPGITTAFPPAVLLPDPQPEQCRRPTVTSGKTCLLYVEPENSKGA